MTNKKGFTIIEIVVTLFIVMAALAIGYYTFVKVLRLSIYHSSTQKSQINTLMGTALLRYDCEMAGYGLPDNVTISYEEATSDSAKQFNTSAPWPFQIGNGTKIDNATNETSSYLVIRSTIANINDASRKWSILYYDGTSWKIQGYNDGLSWPKSEQDYHFSSKDGKYYAIILHDKDLYATKGEYRFQLGELLQNANLPPLSGYTYIVYGLDPDTKPRMPFNRVDYYLDNKNVPKICAPNTFVLYRATINQSNGSINPQPLLDCVAKFEVALKSGNVWYTRYNPLDLNSSLNAQEVRIFIVQQSGKLDPSYTNTSKIILGDNETASLLNEEFEPTGDQVHYQWKLITLSVRPRNLVQ